MRGAIAKDRVAKPPVLQKTVSVASMLKTRPAENTKSSNAAHGQDSRKNKPINKKQSTREPPHPLSLAFRGKFSISDAKATR